MVQSTHIQYMIEYFIKFGNHLNDFCKIFTIHCYEYYFLTSIYFNHLISIKKYNFF
jgi:hypothetical protein